MRKYLLAVCSLIIFHQSFAQSKTVISGADLQYIKDFFAANFIKSEIKDTDGQQSFLFNYEITNDAIILYKQVISREARESGLAHSWYYLAFDNILFRNWNTDIGYYKNANALRIQEKEHSIPHGIGKKFTKPADAKYEAGWVMPPFKYKSYDELARLKNIFEPVAIVHATPKQAPVKAAPVSAAPAEKKSPAPLINEEPWAFKSFSLSRLYNLARQFNETNMETIMQSAGYTLEEGSAKSQLYKYKQEGEGTVFVVQNQTDSNYIYVLKSYILGMEVENLLKEFEDNKIVFAGDEKKGTSHFYYFAKEQSPYLFCIEEGYPINYVYIFKSINK